MKTLKRIFVPVFALLFTTAVFATDGMDTNKSIETLKKEIKKSLSKLDLSDYTIEKAIKVQFTINDKHELVVMRTDNDDLDDLIKSALNYKSFKYEDIKEMKRNTLYSIKVSLGSNT